MTFPEPFRLSLPGFESHAGDPYGLFEISARAAHGRALCVIACDDSLWLPEAAGWEHVSVSVVGRPDKCPSWDEMCLVKDLFWAPDQAVVQFHPPQSDYINNHPGCLHLWRHTAAPFPMPPSILVGI